MGGWRDLLTPIATTAYKSANRPPPPGRGGGVMLSSNLATSDVQCETFSSLARETISSAA